jgi:hypothetical protein
VLLFLLAGGALMLIMSEALTEHVDNRSFEGPGTRVRGGLPTPLGNIFGPGRSRQDLH